jgi:hypothetical protein
MNIPSIKNINATVTFFSVLVTLMFTLYTFVPLVLASLSPISKEQVVRLLRKHESFVKDSNIEGMSSVYHPDFSIDIIHSSGHKESLDKSQMLKHQNDLKRMLNFSIGVKTQQISMLNNEQALVLLISQMSYSIKGLPVNINENLHQSMLIVKHNNELKILKVLSMAEKNNI